MVALVTREREGKWMKRIESANTLGMDTHNQSTTEHCTEKQEVVTPRSGKSKQEC